MRYVLLAEDGLGVAKVGVCRAENMHEVMEAAHGHTIWDWDIEALRNFGRVELQNANKDVEKGYKSGETIYYSVAITEEELK